ncbi:MAG: FMN-binding protein [Treponema sp.]|nr:FMN-binding protein [Treponema sp.]
MKHSKAFLIFFCLAIALMAFAGCPAEDPSLELLIPPEPQIDGAPSGNAVVQKPGYEKYWAVGGYVEVDMTVEEGYITEVIIFLSHEDLALCREINERWGYNELYGPGWMVERNTVELDVVTGATYTSIAVLEAATEALEHIKNGTQPLPTIKLDKEFLLLAAGTSGTLNATVSLIDVEDLRWSSSNSSIARVSNGIVTARDRNGFSVITARDSEGLAAAECLVVVYGGIDPPTGPVSDAHLTRGRRISIGGRYDPLAGAGKGEGNLWLSDDEGVLAMGKDVYRANEPGDPISSWYIMTAPDGKQALKNVETGNYLNVKGITRGTSNATYTASQPRVSSFEEDDGFYWEFLPVPTVTSGRPTVSYNIVSHGTLGSAADAGNEEAGALSNKDYDPAYYPEWEGITANYATSPTNNEFLSEPCYEWFPYKLVQWRYDYTGWVSNLNDDAYLFDIYDEN